MFSGDLLGKKIKINKNHYERKRCGQSFSCTKEPTKHFYMNMRGLKSNTNSVNLCTEQCGREPEHTIFNFRLTECLKGNRVYTHAHCSQN